MGEEVKRTTYDRTHRQEYRRKVRLCLDVLETMLEQSRFDSDRPLTGMEIECNLVDDDYQPAMSNRLVLDAIADPAYQTELGAYNIEFNVPPRPLPGHTGLDLEAEVRASLNQAETKANAGGTHIVMIGILPTLMPQHLNDGWMSESTRYRPSTSRSSTRAARTSRSTSPARSRSVGTPRPSRPNPLAPVCNCTCRLPRRTSLRTGTRRRWWPVLS